MENKPTAELIAEIRTMLPHTGYTRMMSAWADRLAEQQRVIDDLKKRWPDAMDSARDELRVMLTNTAFELKAKGHQIMFEELKKIADALATKALQPKEKPTNG